IRRNPRIHTPRQVRQIAKSISAFGFNVRILVDADLNVIAGHGCALACRQLGLGDGADDLARPPYLEQAKAFVIADNKLTENSEWNDRLLAEQLKEFSMLDLTFELDVIGFEMAEIDLRIESLSETE